MSTLITLGNYADVRKITERSHRMRLNAVTLTAVVLVVALAVYGFDYYTLSPADRPFSPKHALLRPSGLIGINLGVLGVVLFATIFLYPLRKRISWLAKVGSTRHWLDFHIVFGLVAPVLIAFHSSFKFSGIAGVAFWIMVAVALSGVVGRYVYAQIPRSLSDAELSANELAAAEQELAAELSRQCAIAMADLDLIFRIPSPADVRRLPLYRAVFLMFALDLVRPFQVARLRRCALGWRSVLLGAGLLRTSHQELEHVIRLARRKSGLSKRIAFLSRSQQVFHLWHVIHRPFSYSFAVLALLHITIMLMLGFL